jgi:hypothetical protein
MGIFELGSGAVKGSGVLCTGGPWEGARAPTSESGHYGSARMLVHPI